MQSPDLLPACRPGRHPLPLTFFPLATAAPTPGRAPPSSDTIDLNFPRRAKEMEKDTRVVIEIGGMSCASCVAKLERCIGDVPGVKSASVNLLTESAGMRL